MDHDLEEITDEVLAMKEREFSRIVECITTPQPPSEERIESILKRAKAEAVLKDSADFVADGFGKGLLGIVDTMVCLGTEKNPRRTY